jgi:formiminoglutamase
VEFWRGDTEAIRSGRAVLVGFPQDEGVRRNHGRPGAAEAPREIRRWLYCLAPWNGAADIDLTGSPPLDVGDVRVGTDLEASQEALAEVVATILERLAVPIILGGGHETAYGHFLGYAACGRRAGIINLDAHLDVRPLEAGQGHSGSPFRQALEHPSRPLYACLGAQPHSTSRYHWLYARRQGCPVYWARDAASRLEECFSQERDRMAAAGCHVLVSVDADVVRAADVPGVSAPNFGGLSGEQVRRCVRLAGLSPQVSSLDIVEISPPHDRDGQSARWAALAVWDFLVGLAGRRRDVLPAS